MTHFMFSSFYAKNLIIIIQGNKCVLTNAQVMRSSITRGGFRGGRTRCMPLPPLIRHINQRTRHAPGRKEILKVT